MHDLEEDPRRIEFVRQRIKDNLIYDTATQLHIAKSFLWEFLDWHHRMENGGVRSQDFEEYVERLKVFLTDGNKPKRLTSGH